jgi:hypothetical protein
LEFSDDISGPGVAGEFFSSDHNVMPNTLSPFQMRVNTVSNASVPESSTLTLGVLGIGTLVVLRRRAGSLNRTTIASGKSSR